MFIDSLVKKREKPDDNLLYRDNTEKANRIEITVKGVNRCNCAVVPPHKKKEKKTKKYMHKTKQIPYA